jgi:hypothetical protein
MSRRSISPEFDPRIADWLEDDPDDAPGAVLATVLAAFPSIPQRRMSRVPWRNRPMTQTTRLLAGAGAFALVLVAGVLLLRPGANSTVGGPSPSADASSRSAPPASPFAPSPSPRVSSSAQTIVDATGFAAPFRMTWDVRIDEILKADVVDIFVGNGGLHVFHVEGVSRDPCHSNDLLQPPPDSPRAFMDWLATIPKATTGPVTTLSIGGHDAVERVVFVGTLDGCIDASYLHSGIVSQYGSGPGGYYMTAGEEERWIALEVNGKLIAIAIGPHDDPGIAASSARALQTMEFTP